jgi:GTP-binding protein
MFDLKDITTVGGKGGNGAISFLQLRRKPRGGPDGGDGGAGGNVVVVAQDNYNTLGHLARVYAVEAGDGGSGRGRDSTGKKGVSKKIPVPVGTIVWGIDEKGERLQLADLAEHGKTVLVARGGEPGRGNHRFVSSTNQEPLLAEAGVEGEVRELLLEVKLLADVALIGVPNAGKSTLISAVSRARPKIADYPFTTLDPVLGVAEWKGERVILLDIPGLIEGAHEGKGLGLEFLRHAERVSVLVQLIDGTAESWTAEFEYIDKELAAYPGGLSEKPRIVVVNKTDIPEVKARVARELPLLAAHSDGPPLAISGAAMDGTDVLLDRLIRLMPKGEPLLVEEIELAEESAPRGPHEKVRVEEDDGVFVVTCREAERFVPMVNFSNWRARMQFHQELAQLGVLDALEKRGVGSGDTVRIGSRELEWE